MKKTVVYILSTPYAGSHFLSLQLGSHTKAMHLGELKILRKGPPKEDQRECRFELGEVFQGIGPENIDQVYDIIFSRIDSNIEALIDASKMVHGWADRFLGNQNYNFKFLHLIRDPRALVRRWLQQTNLKRRLSLRLRLIRTYPDMAPYVLAADMPMLFAYNWLMHNRRISDFIRQHGLDGHVVTYRDLALDPATEVQRLMHWIGLEYEPPQLEYWNFEHIGTQKRAYEWVKEKKTKHFDCRWKTDLPANVQNRVINNRLIKAYIKQLGLQVAEDGLTRCAS
jgi:hypothetical protein